MPSPTAPVPLDVRRQHIVDTADALALRNGFRGLTLMDVSERAALVEGELAQHFVTRALLFQAVIDARHRVWMGRVQASCDDVDNRVDKLLAVFSFLEGWFGERAFPHLVFSSTYADLGVDKPWVVSTANRHVAAFTTLIEDFAVAAGLPRSIGTSIALLAEGAQITAALTSTIAPAREARSAAAMLIAVYRMDLDLPDF